MIRSTALHGRLATVRRLLYGRFMMYGRPRMHAGTSITGNERDRTCCNCPAEQPPYSPNSQPVERPHGGLTAVHLLAIRSNARPARAVRCCRPNPTTTTTARCCAIGSYGGAAGPDAVPTTPGGVTTPSLLLPLLCCCCCSHDCLRELTLLARPQERPRAHSNRHQVGGADAAAKYHPAWARRETSLV